MKIKTSQAANSLNLHPANLLLYLADLGIEFDDIWPEIDDSWIEIVRSKDWHKFHKEKSMSDTVDITVKNHQINKPDIIGLGVSENCGLIIEKLWRKDKWGKATITIESIQKLTHISKNDIEVSIAELMKVGLIKQPDTNESFSLNSSKKHEIDRIADLMVKDTSH